MFKGTPTLNAKKISDLVEDAGGHFNAYTGKELTAYYITILNDHLDLTIDILSDILQNSIFPEDEIDRERAVITQEIKMYDDSPDDMVFMNAQKHAFPDQSLGASGLGSAQVIEHIHKENLDRYIRTHYAPNRIVISAAGDINHDEFVNKIEHAFTHLPAQNSADTIPGLVTAQYAPTPTIHEKDTEQAHLILGFKGVSRLDPRHSTMRILSSILGGGTSSRLWQEIREKYGLVYDIHTFHDTYQDSGMFGMYAGTGPNELEQLVPLALDQIRSMRDSITGQELARAKTQITSSVRMGREKMMTRTDQQGRYILGHGEAFNITEFVEKINAVTAQDVTSLTAEMLQSELLVSAYGPIGKLMPVDKIKEKLTT